MKHDQIISVTFQYYLLNSALVVASNEEVLVPSVLLFNAANSSVLTAVTEDQELDLSMLWIISE